MRLLPRLALLFLLAGPRVAAQFSLQPAYPGVTGADGQPLPLAWLGGLNAPQFSASDLDDDGLDDLLIFDRAGDVALALRGDGGGNYRPAPELTAGFPADLNAWVLLRDYDGDGNDDLFTYSARYDGFRIFRGRRSAAGLLTFADAPTYPGLRYPLENGTTTPIFITNVDYPNFDDLDGDGDLDLLTFSVGGGFVEYYKNQSVERGFGTDTLLYTLESNCWGGFFESGLTPALDLAPAPGDCVSFLKGTDPVEVRHAGSTVLTLDVNGNGLKDILLGDISFTSVVAGFNTGTREQAYISSQDANWPSADAPVDIPFFPATFYFDVDQDGVRDLVASPNQTLNAADIEVAWYYRNVGTESAPDFTFQDDQLFVRQSIDYGSGARPAVVDVDADGRPDLVIGNSEEYSDATVINSRLRLFRNVTPAGGAPAFAFADDDFLDLQQFQTTTSAFAPTFGDLDGDGDTDAVVGERGGQLIYLENIAGPGQPLAFANPVFGYMDIDVIQFSKPAIADLDRDGRNDLIIGGFDGRIRYFRNLGTLGSPNFNPDPTAAGNILQLGDINTNVPGSSTGYPAPVVLDYPDRFLLLTGNRAGTVEAYEFTDHATSFTLLADTVAGLDVGGFSDPAPGDFDGDGILELVIGNQRGGVTFFNTDLPVDQTTALSSVRAPAFDFVLTPNPAREVVHLSGLPGTRVQGVRVMSSLGQLVRTLTAGGLEAVSLPLAGLPAGLYLVSVDTPAGSAVRRVVVR